MVNKFSFYVLVKNFNSKKVEKYDVMPALYDEIFTEDGKLSENFYVLDNDFNKIKVNSKESLKTFIKVIFMHRFWSKCEYEFICIDWPYTEDSIEKSNPVKVDVYRQLEPNIDIIAELLWIDIKNLV